MAREMFVMQLPNPANRDARKAFDRLVTCMAVAANAALFLVISVVVVFCRMLTHDSVTWFVTLGLVLVFIGTLVAVAITRIGIYSHLLTGEVLDIYGDTRKEFRALAREVGMTPYGMDYDGELFNFQRAKNAGVAPAFVRQFQDQYGSSIY